MSVVKSNSMIDDFAALTAVRESRQRPNRRTFVPGDDIRNATERKETVENQSNADVIRNAADLSYEVDKWTREVCATEVERTGSTLGAAISTHTDKVDAPTKMARLGRELFGRLYGMGTDDKMKPEGQEWASKLHDEAEVTPEWKDAIAKAEGDPWLSDIGSGAVLDHIAGLLPDAPEPGESSADQQARLDYLRKLAAKAGGGTEKTKEAIAKLEQDVADAKEFEQMASDAVSRDAAQIRRALRVGAQKANDEMDKVLQAVRGLGAGSGAAQPSRDELRSVLRDGVVARVAALAGRFRQRARKKHAEKVVGLPEETVGVTKGRELERLLPTELACFTDPLRAAQLYSRMVEGAALTYEMRGREKKSAGPIVFVVDESSSMGSGPGSKHEWAKAFALGVMEIAVQQRRPFAIVHFSKSCQIDYYTKPEHMTPKAIAESIRTFLGGGTDLSQGIDHGLLAMRNSGWKDGAKADIVLLTDAMTREVGTAVSAIKTAREQGTGFYYVGIGDAPGNDIANACTEAVHLNASQLDSIEKLDGVFAL